MHAAVVIGAYHFVGFQLAKHLLNEGEEVLGVDWKEPTDEIEEMQLEIGRNSHYLYVPLHKLDYLAIERQGTIYVSFYELLISSYDDSIVNDILSFIQSCEHYNNLQIIALVPQYIAYHRYDFLLQALLNVDIVRIVYLPTIYGPWQPENMVFEHVIRQKDLSTIQTLLESEGMEDAIYIADLTSHLHEILLIDDREVYVKSANPNQWKECAQLIMDQERVTSLKMEENIKRRGAPYILQNTVSPLEGIEEQKKHAKRLQLLREWKRESK